jgi:hypothetical protein
MDEAHEAVKALEHEITQLLEQLQRAVQPPTFSYRLEEMRPLIIRLVASWARYQRDVCPLPEGHAGESSLGAQPATPWPFHDPASR